MQEIEFRLIYQHDGTGRFITTFITLDELLKSSTRVRPFDKYTLIAKNQFIGKFDKNERKIFTGDIVNVFFETEKGRKIEKFIVKWDNTLCGYTLWDIQLKTKWKGTNPFIYLYEDEIEIRIIGNEIENTELLEGSLSSPSSK